MTEGLLPDGQLYYNIAERTIRPALEHNLELVNAVASQVQAALNEAAGIGIKPVSAILDDDRVHRIVSAAADTPSVSDMHRWLGEAVVNTTQSFADDFIRRHVSVDRSTLIARAKAGERHAHSGVYVDAAKKTKKQLQKSIASRASQVERHADKIQHPQDFVDGWNDKTPREQQGLIKKWEKDMRRNAEQAEIELAVFEERF